MELMTKELAEKLKQNPIYSHDGEGLEAEVIVKYFNAFGSGTWLITEGEEQEDGDWLFFGYCHLFEWEWGYVRLSDLLDLNKAYNPPIIERDLYSKGKVKDLI
jgi:hypothetical protein